MATYIVEFRTPESYGEGPSPWRIAGSISIPDSLAGPGMGEQGREALEAALTRLQPVPIYAPRGLDHVAWTKPERGEWRSFTIREGGTSGEAIVRGTLEDPRRSRRSALAAAKRELALHKKKLKTLKAIDIRLSRVQDILSGTHTGDVVHDYIEKARREIHAMAKRGK